MTVSHLPMYLNICSKIWTKIAIEECWMKRWRASRKIWTNSGIAIVILWIGHVDFLYSFEIIKSDPADDILITIVRILHIKTIKAAVNSHTPYYFTPLRNLSSQVIQRKLGHSWFITPQSGLLHYFRHLQPLQDRARNSQTSGQGLAAAQAVARPHSYFSQR